MGILEFFMGLPWWGWSLLWGVYLFVAIASEDNRP